MSKRSRGEAGSGSGSGIVGKSVLGVAGLGCTGLGGCLITIVMFMVIVVAVAGSILSWLFGGGAPDGQANPRQAPVGEVHFWTPTPIPADCFITPSPVAVTVTPANTPAPPINGSPASTPAPPGGTAGPGPGPSVVYLPTATPCPPPPNNWATPNPAYPPVVPGGRGNYDIRQGKITLSKVQQILQNYPSGSGPNPLTPDAQRVIDFQYQYGINGGFALAWFVQESSMCTTGISPSAVECANIRWTENGGCVTHNYDTEGRDFCGYASWSDAIEAWFKLMSSYYFPNQLTTVGQIVYVYAPCSDQIGGCDFVNHYIDDVIYLVQQWGVAPEQLKSANNEPHGNPFHSGYIVTQPYGCTDFNLEFYDTACARSTSGRASYFHRGVDLVSQGDTTVYATIDGQVDYAGYTGDGFGIRAYVVNGPYLVIYPHLSQVFVAAGQRISYGQPIGREGSTGNSTGDHLHYEIHINGAFVDSTPYLMRP